MRWPSILCCSALALAALSLLGTRLSSDARASTALRLSVEELIADAAVIYQGQVLERRSQELAPSRIYTDYLISIERTFLGTTASTRTLRLPGGVLSDGRGTLIPGLPHPVPGDEFLWFLSTSADDSTQMPMGLAQGSFRLLTAPDGERVAVRSQGALTLVDPDSGSLLGEGTRDVMAYADLLARIEAGLVRRSAATDSKGQK